MSAPNQAYGRGPSPTCAKPCRLKPAARLLPGDTKRNAAAVALGLILALGRTALGGDPPARHPVRSESAAIGHHEYLDDPPMPRPATPPQGIAVARTIVERDGYVSVQVNVDELGNNIPGDAANEPSVAVDPTAPGRIVIGWR